MNGRRERRGEGQREGAKERGREGGRDGGRERVREGQGKQGSWSRQQAAGKSRGDTEARVLGAQDADWMCNVWVRIQRGTACSLLTIVSERQ